MLNKSRIPEEDSRYLPSGPSLGISDGAQSLAIENILAQPMLPGGYEERQVKSSPAESKNNLLMSWSSSGESSSHDKLLERIKKLVKFPNLTKYLPRYSLS